MPKIRHPQKILDDAFDALQQHDFEHLEALYAELDQIPENALCDTGEKLWYGEKALFQIEMHIQEMQYRDSYVEAFVEDIQQKLKKIIFNKPPQRNSANEEAKWETFSAQQSSEHISPHGHAELFFEENKVDQLEAKRTKLSTRLHNIREKRKKTQSIDSERFFNIVSLLFEGESISENNLSIFLEKMINFFKICNSDLERYSNALQQRFDVISESSDDLIKWHNYLHTPQMLAVINAFFAVKQRLGETLVTIWDIEADTASADADATLTEYYNSTRWHKEHMTQEELYGSSSRIHVLLNALYEGLNLALRTKGITPNVHEERLKADVMGEWPLDSQGERILIPIEPRTRQLVSNTVQALHSAQLQPVKILPVFVQEQQLNEAFSQMMDSLGYFFNPMKFCQSMHKMDTKDIPEFVQHADEKTLRKLYQHLQGADFNQLVALLRHINKGDDAAKNDLCSWLPFENNQQHYDALQRSVKSISEPIEQLLACVSKKLGIIDDSDHENWPKYPCDTITTMTPQIRTHKNAACIKSIWEDANTAEQQMLKIPRTWAESFYNWIYNPKETISFNVSEPLKKIRHDIGNWMASLIPA